jgi:hypothetical protein
LALKLLFNVPQHSNQFRIWLRAAELLLGSQQKCSTPPANGEVMHRSKMYNAAPAAPGNN